MTASPIRIYGIKNCDTMKKACAWLTAHGISHAFIDYRKADIAAAHLPDWIARSNWRTLLNTRGLMWKKLEVDERANVDADRARELMIRYPVLIKRPVLDTGEDLLIGFDPERYAQVFL
ncbi:MAG: Spx/MgsR family RNA polymerase-binding regulatory protein [Zoogloeaceae bacterium]|nr:Spx/MgsR family RNA polymerase-binding regulatory protein [Zoogloeaceae bacterium]